MSRRYAQMPKHVKPLGVSAQSNLLADPLQDSSDTFAEYLSHFGVSDVRKLMSEMTLQMYCSAI